MQLGEEKTIVEKAGLLLYVISWIAPSAVLLSVHVSVVAAAEAQEAHRVQKDRLRGHALEIADESEKQGDADR